MKLQPMIRDAITDAVKKALKCKPVNVHVGKENFQYLCYEIDGEIYDETAAIEKVLGEYIWWKE